MMFYADVGLSGIGSAYKRRFLKWVENAHQYYMPDLGGMCDMAYHEKNADHWVYVRYTDETRFHRILDVLRRRYKFTPEVYKRDAKTIVAERDNKTYADLNYETRDYTAPDYHLGLHPEDNEEEIA